MQSLTVARVILLFASTLFIACEKTENEGACKSGYRQVHHEKSSFDVIEAYTGQAVVTSKTYYIFTNTTPNQIIFFIAENVGDICPDEHMKIDVEIKMKNVPQPLPMYLSGEARWSIYGDDILLHNGLPTPGQVYKGSFSIGLKQAFGSNAGNVDIEAVVQFAAGSDLNVDKNYLKDHIEYMKVSTRYSLH